jgi:hypothetical protein
MSATPAAARKSVELFNRMATIGVNDVEEAVQCVFQLRTLARQGKLDFLGRVALAEALLIAGHRDEAVEQVEAAFHTADLTDYEGMDRLSMALAHVGMRDRALSINKQLARSQGFAATSHILVNATFLALWAGDIEYLEELAGLQEASGAEGPAGEYLRAIEGRGLRAHLSTHQRVVIECAKDAMVYGTSNMALDEVGAPMIFNTVLIDGRRASRREIEDRIASALEGYYSSAGDEGADIDAIATIVSEAPRQLGLEPTKDTGRAA